MRQVSSLKKKKKSFLIEMVLFFFFLLQITLFNDKCIYIDTDTRASKRERIKSEYIRMNVECGMSG
jgi:hypothetical protein